MTEDFTAAERARLEPRFTNLDRRCFALRNLPETVKGALFARYSRSAKSLRRLYLDEFDADLRQAPDTGAGEAAGRAAALYDRVLGQYGDDSVAQLGSAHIACEGVSNVLTKVLERGRLMSYLEQSTRYVPYTERPNGRWKYVTPSEIGDLADRRRYRETLDNAFETYARFIGTAEEHFRRVHPAKPGDNPDAWKRAIRSRALDTLRGLLPAATRSNLGIHGSGQAFEALLLRLGTHPLAEAQRMGQAMLAELRQVIPAFVQRVDREDRGGAWRDYLCARHAAAEDAACTLPDEDESGPGGAGNDVRLIDWKGDGETSVLAAALYPHTDHTLGDLYRLVQQMPPEERVRTMRRIVGERSNRRHRPGRAFEHADYTFEVAADYGAFRDLQRHRMLTIDWQRLTTRHGVTEPDALDAIFGLRPAWDRVMDEAQRLDEHLRGRYGADVAQYAVPMACRIRFTMRMNAREAMHVIELRTQPAGHPSYRRICQGMHQLIREQAGHEAIADAIRFANHDDTGLGRIDAENRQERGTAQAPPPA
ncbi:MAG: thymidylate synthase [Acidobacteria bacterium]|nr:thymidylate synthase [Acidobacteriota bacterium]MYH30455.1 thymidylate synthase [Acidobacteriota bacterium]MYK87081.1 thymidylate synthase [Acidobacteriota bacterium]